MERETRRDKLSRERAEWESEQALKKQNKAAQREAESALKEQRKVEKKASRERVKVSEYTDGAEAGDLLAPVAAPFESDLLPQPDMSHAQVLKVSPDERVRKQKRVKASRHKEPRRSAGYKNALRLGLEDSVANMLDERDSFLREWRSGASTPEEAVNRLSTLSVRTKDGALWKLLPRHGGVGLIKTGMDGNIAIIEPPRKRKRWPTVVSCLLFALLVTLTLWGTFWPATDSSQPDSGSRVTNQQEE